MLGQPTGTALAVPKEPVTLQDGCNRTMTLSHALQDRGTLIMTGSKKRYLCTKKRYARAKFPL